MHKLLMGRKVFISKHASEVPDLSAHLTSNGDRLIAHSFLRFTPLDFELETSYDIVFFGSPRAVIFFQAQQSISGKAMIACVGKKTRELLENLGHTVAFSGEGVGSPDEIAEAFRTWANGRHVLFPLSDISLKSISKNLPDSQKTELVIYQTSLQTQKIEESDAYVFSSPSNVKGFLKDNSIPDGAQVIAWGESTAAELTQNAIDVSEILSAASVEQLIKSLRFKK